MLETLIEQVRPKAELRASAPGSRVRSAFDAGEVMLARAREAAGAYGPDTALYAEFALQSYVATLMWPEGMVFVPAGQVELNGKSVWVPPFFIDEAEVTAGQFAQFCREVQGGWPNPLPDDYPGDFPVTMVTYYDAQAYAAWKGPARRQGKLLPVEAQWLRAAGSATLYPWGDKWSARAAKTRDSGEDGLPAAVKSHDRDKSEFGCFDMAGNVSEWTRSFFDAAEAARFGDEPNFGAHLVVRGGNFNTAEVTVHDRFYEVFEQRRPDLGFRCVLQIPHDPAFIDSLAAG
jgi:formylglycine-generating enzyme required for sulfatase activity